MTTKLRFTARLLILILFLMPLYSQAEENSFLPEISRANDLYDSNQYKEAAAAYQDLIDRGLENGYLYYNLGNAYFRQGKIAPSILYYLKARRLIPRDESLQANLDYVIGKTADRLQPHSSGLLINLFFWIDDFNSAEHVKFLALVNLLFWISLALWFRRRSGFWDATRKVFMSLLVLSMLSCGVKIYIETRSSTGVILAKEIDVKSAQGTDNVTLFQLHEGAVISIVHKENDWYQIELEDGKKGWTQKEFVGS